jgi:hypothetical protein
MKNRQLRGLLPSSENSCPECMSRLLGDGFPRSTNMQKYLIAAVLVVSFTAPILAAETFYIIFDNTMKGCTIVTTEPTDKARYKILGKYTSNAEAEKAIASMKEC